MTRDIEIEAADALLDIGVSLPLLRVRIPFRRKPVEIRLTMRRPNLGSQIRIARLYLKTGVTYEEMARFTKHDELAFLARHGKTVSLMVALTVCRGRLTGLLLTPVVAWMLRRMVDDRWVAAANLRFVSLLGTKSFMNIIGSAQQINPLAPRTSQGKRGS